MTALAAVNDRVGRGALRVGDMEGRQAWHMSQNAPNCTTECEGLPTESCRSGPILLISYASQLGSRDRKFLQNHARQCHRL